MATAGRILIIPRGDYSTTYTYEMLDMVNYNGVTWLAKKTAVGIEPSDENSEYWFKIANDTVESSVVFGDNIATITTNIVQKNANVVNVTLDFTVGKSNIPEWEYFAFGLPKPSSIRKIVPSMFAIVNEERKPVGIYFNIGTNGNLLAYAPLTATYRYIMSFSYMI